MKRVCDVGRWTVKKQRSCRCSTNPSLPHEVIESILSRLPVKDLLRFKVVCKQWKATICDPVFTETHLQRHKKILLASGNWDNHCYLMHFFELQDNYCIEFVSTIEVPHCLRGMVLCSCDGLFLKTSSTDEGDGQPEFVLWNPSCRTYRELYGPELIDLDLDLDLRRIIYGMYYDPLKKDYKIVVADMEHYAVYSCRDNKWSDTKEMKGFLGGEYYDGVFFNGFIYWQELTCFGYPRVSELISYDCKNEDFKRLPIPNIKNCEDEYFTLTSFGGHLCMLIFKPDHYSYSKIEIMKKMNSSDEWMESKEECLCSFRLKNDNTSYLCILSENEILFDVWKSFEESDYVVYDKSKNTLVKISGNHPPSW